MSKDRVFSSFQPVMFPSNKWNIEAAVIAVGTSRRRSEFSALNYHESAVVPDHKVNIPVGLERRAWRRARKDYPNPLLDAFLTLFGIAVVVIALWFLL